MRADAEIATCNRSCGMAILAMGLHRRDARATVLFPRPKIPRHKSGGAATRSALSVPTGHLKRIGKGKSLVGITGGIIQPFAERMFGLSAQRQVRLFGRRRMEKQLYCG
jgi:hypothetical protein